MAEYIEREALSEYFREKFEYYKAESEIKVCGGYMYDEKMQYAAIVAKHFLDELKRTPTADVVEVVRCKDCKHSKIDNSGTTICILNSECDEETGVDYGFVSYCSENHFCSYGERRLENENT